MINLQKIYGDRIFNRKAAYRKAQYIPFIYGFMIDMVVAFAIIWFFEIEWNYAFIKVYGILLCYDLLKYIFSSFSDYLNYKLWLRKAIASEIRHYLEIFSGNVNWREIATYDDFLLECTFNENLANDLRVLAAINYGAVANAMLSTQNFENRCHKVFSAVAPEFIQSRQRYDNKEGAK